MVHGPEKGRRVSTMRELTANIIAAMSKLGSAILRCDSAPGPLRLGGFGRGQGSKARA